MTERFHEIRVSLVNNAAEIRETRDSMGKISDSFTRKTDAITKKLEEVYIGEGRYRLTETKKKGGV